MADDMLPAYHDLSYKCFALLDKQLCDLAWDGPPWHECGTEVISNVGFWGLFIALSSPIGGAGDRDRTGMTSLEGCGPQRSELLLPRSGAVPVSP
jgi:hypothetical protein